MMAECVLYLMHCRVISHRDTGATIENTHRNVVRYLEYQFARRPLKLDTVSYLPTLFSFLRVAIKHKPTNPLW